MINFEENKTFLLTIVVIVVATIFELKGIQMSDWFAQLILGATGIYAGKSAIGKFAKKKEQ